MKSTQDQFQEFADRVQSICRHISVRTDENGPYVFALGLKDTHTLQLRKVGESYVLELWHGANADEEKVVDEPTFSIIGDAFSKAEEWLLKDAI